MPLPVLQRCCGFLSLRAGSIIFTIISLGACALNITVGVMALMRHKHRDPEDNFISMGMVMFSTLSAISNMSILFAIILKRHKVLQWALLLDSMFILYSFLVGFVTCMFSPELASFMISPRHVLLVVFIMLFGIAYCVFFLLVINSFYQQVKTATNNSVTPA